MRVAISTKGVVTLFALLLSLNALAEDAFNYPGGIAEFRFEKRSSELPEVKFGLREPVILEGKNDWRVLVGLGLDLLPGEYVSYVKNGIKDTPGEHIKVIVRQKSYPFSEFDSADDANKNWSVLLDHKSLSDIDFSNTRQPSLPLRFPFEGNWSDTFGHKMYDVERETLHVPNSISLATTQLGMVVAPQNAIVSKTSVLEDGSSVVFLDHGRGLYSVISGLGDLTVDVGNGIVAGAVIGRLPSATDEANDTKRLVWQTLINGAYVNPLILTQIKP